jgi:hypothetical protein
MEPAEVTQFQCAISIPAVLAAEPNGRVEEEDKLTPTLHVALTPETLADISCFSTEATMANK